MTFSVTDLAAIEAHLATHAYLSGGDKPGKVDASVLTQLREKKITPNVATNPNLYGWFSFVGLFTPEALALWVDATAPATVAPAVVTAPAPAKAPAAKDVIFL